jgi:exosortase
MNRSTDLSPPLTAWRLIGALALVAVAVGVTSDVWADILAIATRDEESSQVLLVPLVVAWLVWVRRQRWRECRVRQTWIGPPLIAVGWLLSTLGYHHAIQSFWHGGAVLATVGCFLTVAGSDLLKRFMPVFVVLVFLIPVPGMARQQIAIPLQSLTAHLTQIACEIFGFDVGRTGNVLSINGFDVEVAEACNGMRMVFALILVSFAFAYGTKMPNYARLLIVLGSPLAAVLCNVLRLIPTVWLYGNYPEQVAVQFHDISGWVMLPIAFLLLVGFTRLIRWVLATPVEAQTTSHRSTPTQTSEILTTNH